DDSIGIKNISLLHLNDTNQPCGSRIDKHALIGEGEIGEEALKQFVLDERLSHIPIILELPVLPEEQEDAMLQKIRTWHC
ncbi:MAG TPA: endonuclease IV, partial [Candidatus Dependentiae bacterium]|nr:endonuclease IV [Candidatus Dependentiae bacterium]